MEVHACKIMEVVADSDVWLHNLEPLPCNNPHKLEWIMKKRESYFTIFWHVLHMLQQQHAIYVN